MPELISLSDVQQIAVREALRASQSLLGITKTPPRFVEFPEDSNTFEFVVDCFILQSPSQSIALGSTGLSEMKDVLVASDASGDLLADIHVPVEIRKNNTGQLEIVGRAKVALPTLRLDEYTPEQLKVHHVRDLSYDEESSSWQDAFGVQYNIEVAITVGSSTSVSTGLSTLGQLAYDDNEIFIGLGVNTLQRVVVAIVTDAQVRSEEVSAITESVTIV